MTVKKFVFSGLLLSSVFLVACQPQKTDTTMMEETTPVLEDERIMIEGTDQPIPGEEEMMLEETTPAVSPMIEGDAEVDAETNM